MIYILYFINKFKFELVLFDFLIEVYFYMCLIVYFCCNYSYKYNYNF